MKAITQKEAADLVRLSARQFRDSIDPLIEEGGKTGAGAKLRYVPEAVVAAAIKYRVDQTRASLIVDQGGDPLLSGGDSVNLERYRGFKADQEEIKVRHLRGEVIYRNEIEPALLMMGRTLRETGDRISRKHGNDAGKMLNDAVNAFIGEIGRVFAATAAADSVGVQPSDSVRRADQNPDAPLDAAVRGGRDLAADGRGGGRKVPDRPQPVRRRPA